MLCCTCCHCGTPPAGTRPRSRRGHRAHRRAPRCKRPGSMSLQVPKSGSAATWITPFLGGGYLSTVHDSLSSAGGVAHGVTPAERKGRTDAHAQHLAPYGGVEHRAVVGARVELD